MRMCMRMWYTLKRGSCFRGEGGGGGMGPGGSPKSPPKNPLTLLYLSPGRSSTAP